jgi:hypothetical protein
MKLTAHMMTRLFGWYQIRWCFIAAVVLDTTPDLLKIGGTEVRATTAVVSSPLLPLVYFPADLQMPVTSLLSLLVAQ